GTADGDQGAIAVVRQITFKLQEYFAVQTTVQGDGPVKTIPKQGFEFAIRHHGDVHTIQAGVECLGIRQLLHTTQIKVD
ncbi:hypothetical protein DF186_24535, partial [Enterococcus hirae]